MWQQYVAQSQRLKRRRIRDERTWWLLVTVVVGSAFAWYVGHAMWFIATLTSASFGGLPPSRFQWWVLLFLKTGFVIFIGFVFVSLALVVMTSVAELLKRTSQRSGNSR